MLSWVTKLLNYKLFRNMENSTSAIPASMAEKTEKPRSLWSVKTWLTTQDHQQIGLLYLASVALFFVLGATFAMIVRYEASMAGRTIISNVGFTRLITAHGAIMVLLVAMPALSATLGTFLMPRLLGAENLPFPRLQLSSLHLYWLGGLILLVGTLFSATPVGWTLIETFSTDDPTTFAVIWMATGILILGASAIMRSINFVVAIHKLRSEKMGLFKMPLFAWGLYLMSVIHIVVMFLMGITSQLLILEKTIHFGLFDTRLGGDPLVYQHFFWFAAYPALYSTLLPALGLIADVVQKFSQRRISGYQANVFAMVAYALLCFTSWGQQLATSGQSEIASVMFSAFANLSFVPLALITFNVLATLYKGSISLRAPMIYAFMFLFMFIMGLLGSLPLNASVFLQNTTYATAQFHFLILGGVGMALLAGLHYWWPQMSGRMYNERSAKWSAGLTFLGMIVTFFGQFLLGSNGLSPRMYDFEASFNVLQVISTLGSFILGTGLFSTLYLLMTSTWQGEPATQTVWDEETA